MTVEPPRAAECCCCNARLTLIVLLCFDIFVGAIFLLCGLASGSTFILSFGMSSMAFPIFFFYGAVKRQPCILMTGFILKTIGAVFLGIVCLIFVIMGSVFAKSLTDLAKMGTSSGGGSGQGSSMSSQQQQQMEEITTFMTGPFIVGVAIAVIVTFMIQVMICYLYFIVYREAKRFQDNEVTICTVGVVIEQGSYPNYPPCETKTHMA